MTTVELVLFCVFVPVIGAFLLPLLGKLSVKLRNYLALSLILSSCVTAFLMLPAVLTGQTFSITKMLPLGFNLAFSADTLAVFMAIVSSLIGAVIIFYSIDYISHYENQNEYYFLVVLFLGSMMGIIFSANLILLYVFWEITAITSWRLIGFFRERQYVLRADKSFLVTFFGAVMMLIGFIMVYQQTGSFDYNVIKQSLAENPLTNLAVFLILFGIFSKSATLPFHTWLPDAGVAPSPVTALLHAAVLVKIGTYVFARLFIATFSIDVIWTTIIPVVAGLSAIIAAGAALVDTDLKRIIAYSTISQIGFIFLGLSTGSSLGVAGAMLYILTHGLAKGGLFLCAGIVEQKTKIKDITKLGGLIRTMPVTAISFLLCAFSVMGIPPFGGFFAKYMVITGAIKGGHPYIAAFFIAGAFLTLLYLMRVFNMVFLGESEPAGNEKKAPFMLISVSFLAFLGILSGIFIKNISVPILVSVSQMMGAIK